ncbi:MAG: hypothetical protein EOO29_12150 [Comamonadaceae bacterium]|nr:MAG: hypothetical protein EOO29_12150 [Comamonadaceae bacterium]
MQSLQSRLAAQGFTVLRLPGHTPPSSWPAAGSLAARQPAASLALESHAIPDDGGFTLLAAEIAPSAPEAMIVAARAQWARSTLVLLCATGPQDGTTGQALDTWLRSQLLAAKVAFSVLHGEGDAALAQAWQALCAAAGGPLRAALTDTASSNRSWFDNCDACSDSACEHRLFSDLLARRGNA